MNKLSREIIKIAVLGGLLLVVQAFAFSEPTAPPPGGNVPAPINIGDATQTKTGGLIITGLRTLGATFLATDADNVGIGNTAPAAKLDISGNIKIADGTQGAGKVLTSDANGVASWQPPTAGGILFGGMFRVTSGSCPAIQQWPATGGFTCKQSNFFNGGSCGCPAGFSAYLENLECGGYPGNAAVFYCAKQQ